MYNTYQLSGVVVAEWHYETKGSYVLVFPFLWTNQSVVVAINSVGREARLQLWEQARAEVGLTWVGEWSPGRRGV